MAVRFGEHCVFISTDDKNKIKVGEPNCPISAVTSGRQALVGLNQVVKSADHDFASMTLIPTVILVHDIPDEVDKSWYRGHAHIYMRISATEPSSALRNSAEIENVVIQRYGRRGLVPSILIIYTGGGPEHRTTYLSVNIAMIALQKSLNLDLLLTVRTAPGSSHRNPSERVNCILNLGLYGIGVMRQKIFDKPEFERKLCHCSNVDEVRQLIKENPAANTELVRRACADTISLIRSVFERLVLKDNNFVTDDPMKDDSVKKLFNAIKLDANLAEKDNMTNLNDRPLLKAYLKHCTKERTYFFSVKKCGEPSCTTCLPIRLPRDIFDSFYHLPDPMPSPTNEGYYEQFNTCYGTDTTEDHMPSKKNMPTTRAWHSIPTTQTTCI